MAETFNFDNFQISATGVEEPDLDAQTRTDANVPIRRSVDMKVSNFGALSVGAVMSTDYTRINLGFMAKDDSSDVNVIRPEWQFAEKNENPLLAGSSIKYTRDDQFIRMGMSHDEGAQIDEPGFDVMDTDVVTAEGMVAFTNYSLKNWPTEGFRTFGGKYDFLPYQG
jgi:hypothetical protein